MESFRQPEVSNLPTSRLVLVEVISHQVLPDQPTSVHNRFTRVLRTKEQIFIRKFTAYKDWMPLETGWLPESSMVIISNEEGKVYQVIPTPLEKALQEIKVVEVGLVDDSVPGSVPPNSWLLRPGESFRASPGSLSSVRVRCRSGQAKCILHLFPC